MKFPTVFTINKDARPEIEGAYVTFNPSTSRLSPDDNVDITITFICNKHMDEKIKRLES